MCGGDGKVLRWNFDERNTPSFGKIDDHRHVGDADGLKDLGRLGMEGWSYAIILANPIGPGERMSR